MITDILSIKNTANGNPNRSFLESNI